ncbi:MAG: helix-turn-helix transcriptional regulator [Clostridia bacterium]|nr:helix-turn-helix transcriptional regulator [Clostridia bacterium]
MATIGQRIRELRIRHKQTQDELSRLTGLSRSYISMIECGKREPDSDALEAIADFYNVDMNFLYGKQTEENAHRIITDKEFQLILAYRSASPEVRAIIDKIVER